MHDASMESGGSPVSSANFERYACEPDARDP
ncbi:hypothetical protein DM82_1854 [Burkholderia oklahomensis]|uniref:Uncharacterized protein n=1 Tax=Burkholderia oklahomensis TaxID=342113 RepID=A0AAI8FLK9_9BURK|nr:hypothetical protein DM82_1854 [Burkholderia oklahomensis]AJX31991.1 hypothetical protein BG90_2857 [Burkholderia oklahomensis C6786]